MPNRSRPCAVSIALFIACFVHPTGASADYPPALGSLPMNQVQIIGSHNSYHEAPSPALDAGMVSILAGAPDIVAQFCPTDPDADACIQRFRYTHRPLDEQLEDLAIRQFELDVFADPVGGLYQAPLGWLLTSGNPPPPFDPALVGPGFKVMHVQDLDFATTCFTLVSCLTTIRDWSLANPDHLPILILIEAKDDILPPISPAFPFAIPPAFDAAMFDALDAEILSVFSTDHLLLPSDIKGARATLREGVLLDGWPTLDDARGLVYFALDNGGSYLTDYVTGHPSLDGRVMFTSSPGGSAEAAFFKRNDPASPDIPTLVADGFLVRTRADAETQEAIANDTTNRDLAFASGAQFVSTDYREPDLGLSTYSVSFPDDMSFRCNPLNAPPGCTFVPEPGLAALQLGVLFTLAALRRRRGDGAHVLEG